MWSKAGNHVLLSSSPDLARGIVYSKMIYVNIELNGLCESNIFT